MQEEVGEKEIDRRNAVFWYFMGVMTTSVLGILLTKAYGFW